MGVRIIAPAAAPASSHAAFAESWLRNFRAAGWVSPRLGPFPAAVLGPKRTKKLPSSCLLSEIHALTASSATHTREGGAHSAGSGKRHAPAQIRFAWWM